MAQLRRDYEEFRKRGAEVVVLGPEGRARFEDYWRCNHLPFVGLPDPSHTVLRLYGQQVNLFKLGRMPAQVIIDREGRVRFAHYGHSMRDIPRAEQSLAVLDQLNREEGLAADDRGGAQAEADVEAKAGVDREVDSDEPSERPAEQ